MKQFMSISFLLLVGIMQASDFGEEMNYFDSAEQGTGYYKPRYTLSSQKTRLGQELSNAEYADKDIKKALNYDNPWSVHGQREGFLKRLNEEPSAEDFRVRFKQGWNRLIGRPAPQARGIITKRVHGVPLNQEEKRILERKAEKSYDEAARDLRYELVANDFKIDKLQKRNEQLQEVEKNLSRGVTTPGPLYGSTERPFQVERRGAFARMLDKLGNAGNSAWSWIASKWYR